MDRTGNIRRAGWLLTLAMCAASGCQTVRTPEEKIASSNIPSEFKKVSMPDYIVEPPDLVLVEVLEALPGGRSQASGWCGPTARSRWAFTAMSTSLA